MVATKICEVKYNRSLNIYEAVNGRLVAQGGKRHCQLEALKHDRPDIHAEIVAIIANVEAAAIFCVDVDAITKRAIKAGFILRDGLLQPPRPFEKQEPGEVAYCLSQSGSGAGYSIVENCHREGYVICSCFDWYNAPKLESGQVACKHVLAHMVAESLFSPEVEHDEF